MNCADDITAVDVQASIPGTLPSSSTSSTVSLFPFILHSRSTGYNLSDPTHLPRVLRPLDTKDVAKTNDELVGSPTSSSASSGVWSAGCLDSQDGDDEILLHVVFSNLVRIKSVLLNTGGGRTPYSSTRVKVWVNRADGIAFGDVEDVRCDQEWELLESPAGGAGCVEYPVRMTRFGNVNSVDLFLSGARSGTMSRLFYLGFMGESKVLTKEPGDMLQIAAENGVDKQIDGVKEEKRGAHAVK